MQLVLGTLAHMSGSWPRPGSRLAMVTQPSSGSSSSTVNTPGPKGSLHQLVATWTYLMIRVIQHLPPTMTSLGASPW